MFRREETEKKYNNEDEPLSKGSATLQQNSSWFA